jgi:hypothetical protein
MIVRDHWMCSNATHFAHAAFDTHIKYILSFPSVVVTQIHLVLSFRRCHRQGNRRISSLLISCSSSLTWPRVSQPFDVYVDVHVHVISIDLVLQRRLKTFCLLATSTQDSALGGCGS